MAKKPKDVNVVVAVRRVHLALGSARPKVPADLAEFLPGRGQVECLR